MANHEQALQQVLDWLEARHPSLTFHAAGQRVVHGGAEYIHSVRIDAGGMADWNADPAEPPASAPQPGGHPLARLRPDLPQVACFDTAFPKSRFVFGYRDRVADTVLHADLREIS